MRRGVAAGGLVLLAWFPVSAGELIFANGTRLAGELANEALLVSTGSGLVEVAAEEVVALSREEIQLRDGRVIRGTLVGGLVRAKTALGEIAVKVDELDLYRASGTGRAGSPVSPASSEAPAAAPGLAAARAGGGADGAGLPAIASYQPPAPAPRLTPAAVVQPSVPGPGPRRLEVVGETPLYRDAVSGSARIGHVARGQQVMYLDSIDRRLRILNHLLFDGGTWVKVRLADGTEGWIPAHSVRELR